MQDLILEVKNLTVRMGEEKVISNLSFTLRRQDILTILGPNGSGKTTLLRALLGLIPYEGNIVWKGHVNISYLPQRLPLLRFQLTPLSVKDFFGFKGVSARETLKLLKFVGLNNSQILRENPSKLSSGEFQRMLIAWSLVGNPEILLFDEPTTGIDVQGQETVYSLLHRCWKQKNLTIIMVTHEIDIVYAFASKVLCLGARKLCQGVPREVLTPQALKEIYRTDIRFYKHNH